MAAICREPLLCEEYVEREQALPKFQPKIGRSQPMHTKPNTTCIDSLKFLFLLSRSLTRAIIVFARDICTLFHNHIVIPSTSYNPLVVFLAMVVLILEEEVLVAAVPSESNGRNPQAREAVLESVPPGEDSLVSPRLTATG